MISFKQFSLHEHGLMIGGDEEVHPNRISTRFPTAKNNADNPYDHSMKISLDVTKRDRKPFEHNVGLVAKYGNLRPEHLKGDHDAIAEHFINHAKDNLLWIHDSLHKDMRERSRKWYDGAHEYTKNVAEKYGVPHSSAAAVYAALSPQKDWHKNVSLGDRVLDIYHKQQNHPWSDEMENTAKRIWLDKHQPQLNSIRGKNLGDLSHPLDKAMWIRTHDEAHNPSHYSVVTPEGSLAHLATQPNGNLSKIAWGSIGEIGKAVSAIEANGDLRTISKIMGEKHKIRNFYNNMVDPNGKHGDVTIDTHAVAAGLLRPLSANSTEVMHNFEAGGPAGSINSKGSTRTGIHGTYPLYAEAYRRAAGERSMLPREMQSITWEGVKSLFERDWKRSNGSSAIKGVWQDYTDGHHDIHEARRRIHDIAGGFKNPSWHGT